MGGKNEILVLSLGVLFAGAAVRAQQPSGVSEVVLMHNHDHIQGLETDGRFFWISAVDRRTKTGWIWRVDRKNQMQTAGERNISQGDLYHPGGIQLAGGSLWVSIAEYRRNSSARILELDPMTLTERRGFPVPDHIGAIATDGKTFILGANWDARKFYRWDMAGRLLETVDNPRGLAIQDMKLVDGVLYTGGLEKNECRVEMLDPSRLHFLRAWNPGPEFCYSHEGMALFGSKFYFLPEDEPKSRIYVMAAPR